MPTVARMQEDGQVLQIPIGVDPSLIDPKTWVNFTAPDSDLWLVPSGSDSDSDSDSNVDLHASVVRIVFHYLSFAVGKNHATNLMNAMDAPDALPTFAVASSVAAQSDDTCETVRVPEQAVPLARLGGGTCGVMDAMPERSCRSARLAFLQDHKSLCSIRRLGAEGLATPLRAMDVLG